MYFRLFWIKLFVVLWPCAGFGQSTEAPAAAGEIVQALKQASWQTEGEGFSVLRAITQQGLVVTAFRISPEKYEFEIVLQRSQLGSRARAIGEQSGAVLAVNGGFFAQRENGELYPIGYLRMAGKVLAKGWPNAGGLIIFDQNGPVLRPSHDGIPQDGRDVLQSRPMLIEPGGRWAMGSNLNEAKLRTIFCRRANGDIVLAVISRVGVSLFEAAWVMRMPQDGGFFGCDSAVALDGGRSTQLWYSGEPALSHTGLTPVQNFIVVRQRED